MFERFVGQTPRWVVLKGSEGFLPLPEGEGRGEGKGDARRANRVGTAPEVR